jgi:hypothetical protein
MLALYLAALGFGVTVIGALLMLGGGKDSDGGGDADHGAEADHGDAGIKADHAHAPAVKGDLLRLGPAGALLSVRFWTFCLAAFGATGTLSTLVGVDQIVTFVASLVTGLFVGYGAHLLFRSLQQDRVSGDTELTGLAGEDATVVVAVRPGARGKIRIQRASGTRELMATTRDTTALEPGARVLVIEVKEGVADVTGTGDSELESTRRAAHAQQPPQAERTS